MTLLMREQDIEDETREKDIKIFIDLLKSYRISEKEIKEDLMEKFSLTEDEVISFLE